MERTHAQAKSPHMLAFAVASVASGAFQVAAGTGQVQVSAMTPGGVAFLWSGLAIGGGLSVIIGAYLKDLALGLHVERVGHLALATALVTYLVSLVGVMSAAWWTSTAFWVSALLMVASAIRIFLITRVTWRVKRAARESARGAL